MQKVNIQSIRDIRTPAKSQVVSPVRCGIEFHQFSSPFHSMASASGGWHQVDNL